MSGIVVTEQLGPEQRGCLSVSALLSGRGRWEQFHMFCLRWIPFQHSFFGFLDTYVSHSANRGMCLGLVLRLLCLENVTKEVRSCPLVSLACIIPRRG